MIVVTQVSLKPSHNQDPITDLTVIFPGLGENTPDSYQLIDVTPTKQPADLNHGSFRAPEVFICFRRGRDKPPLIDLGIIEPEKDRMTPGYQLVEFTPNGHIANVNNSANASSFITYRRATELNPCNEFVVMDIAVIIASKGEVPPHTFMKVRSVLDGCKCLHDWRKERDQHHFTDDLLTKPLFYSQRSCCAKALYPGLTNSIILLLYDIHL